MSKTKTTKKRKAKVAAAPSNPQQGDTVLVLRICNSDMSSSHGFTWPEIGHVECPDWRKNNECGNGLHGWLWGEGDHSVAKWTGDNKWLVVEVLSKDVIDLGGKVKFPAGEVVHCGDQKSATEYLRAALPPEKRDAKIIGATATAGYSGTATAGYRGTAAAGDRGPATAGYRGTATAGDRGTATAGDRGTATAGYSGTATAGDSGTATAGYSGTATAGDSGTATAGDSGTATAGEGGMVAFKWYDGDAWRIVVGAVGQDGIEKGKPYHVEGGKIVAGEHPGAKEDRLYAAKLSAMKPGDRP